MFFLKVKTLFSYLFISFLLSYNYSIFSLHPLHNYMHNMLRYTVLQLTHI